MYNFENVKMCVFNYVSQYKNSITYLRIHEEAYFPLFLTDNAYFKLFIVHIMVHISTFYICIMHIFDIYRAYDRAYIACLIVHIFRPLVIIMHYFNVIILQF